MLPLPDTAIETIARAVECACQDQLQAICDVFSRDGYVDIPCRVKVSKIENQGVDVTVDVVIVTNADEKPKWKAEKSQGHYRIRINSNQKTLPGV